MLQRGRRTSTHRDYGYANQVTFVRRSCLSRGNLFSGVGGAVLRLDTRIRLQEVVGCFRFENDYLERPSRSAGTRRRSLYRERCRRPEGCVFREVPRCEAAPIQFSGTWSCVAGGRIPSRLPSTVRCNAQPIPCLASVSPSSRGRISRRERAHLPMTEPIGFTGERIAVSGHNDARATAPTAC